jgi:NitT/TauT family transport system permease protein
MKPRSTDALLLAVGFLVCWQVLYWLVGEDVVSAPSSTIARAIALLRTQNFWHDAVSTGVAFAYACIIGIAGGMILGLLLGLNRFAGDVADPILGTIYSIPKITLYPILLLAFGLGMASKVAFGAIHGVIPVALFTITAVRNVKPIYVKTGRIMALGPLDIIVRILFPAALPEIFAGLRIGFSLTLIGTLLGEMFASQRGLGFLLMSAIGLHNVDLIMALTLLLTLFAGAASVVLLALNRRLYARS